MLLSCIIWAIPLGRKVNENDQSDCRLKVCTGCSILIHEEYLIVEAFAALLSNTGEYN